MQANPYQSSKRQAKRRKQRKIRLIIRSSILAVIILFLIYITNAGFLRIQKIIVNETQYADRNAIENTIKTQLEGRYMGLFSKSNALIFSRGKISRVIRKDFPSVKNVKVNLKGVSEIEVRLTEYEGSSIWCDTPVTPATTLVHDEETGENKMSAIPQVVNSFHDANCYFMNENGMIFAKTTYNSDSEVVKTFGFIKTDPINQSYSTPKTFKNLIEFTKLLRRLNIVADEVWTTDGEVYAFVTKEKVEIYIDGSENIVSTFDNLETVINRDAINQAQFSNIDYIDLRFGNRVFYKLK